MPLSFGVAIVLPLITLEKNADARFDESKSACRPGHSSGQLADRTRNAA
jgi:hypothetical protein